MLFLFAFLFATSSAEQISLTIDVFLEEPIPDYAKKLTGQALVDYVNAKQPFFKAEYSPNAQEFLEARAMDMKYKSTSPKTYITRSSSFVGGIPESFDAREKWPDCPSISYIRDQSACKSSWAVAAAAIMGDRICVLSQGKIKAHISDADILACCGYPCGDGCEGGYPHHAISYAAREGVCSGGRYRDKSVCKPYPLYPCGEHRGLPFYGTCPEKVFDTPKCRHQCQLKYPVSYEDDKIRAQYAYYLPYNYTAIMEDIMTNGPLVATIALYEDFYYYKEGVYVHTAGDLKGTQAVKVIGWGNENGAPYWLLANSWNIDWGDNGMSSVLFVAAANFVLFSFDTAALSCPFLDVRPPDNGMVTFEGSIEEGTFINAMCTNGGELIGPSSIRCIGGKWIPSHFGMCTNVMTSTAATKQAYTL